jgi:hypothetical protein
MGSTRAPDPCLALMAPSSAPHYNSLPIRQVMGVSHYLPQPALPEVPGGGLTPMAGRPRLAQVPPPPRPPCFTPPPGVPPPPGYHHHWWHHHHWWPPHGPGIITIIFGVLRRPADHRLRCRRFNERAHFHAHDKRERICTLGVMILIRRFAVFRNAVRYGCFCPSAPSARFCSAIQASAAALLGNPFLLVMTPMFKPSTV